MFKNCPKCLKPAVDSNWSETEHESVNAKHRLNSNYTD